jgi:hypothetical protein
LVSSCMHASIIPARAASIWLMMSIFCEHNLNMLLLHLLILLFSTNATATECLHTKSYATFRHYEAPGLHESTTLQVNACSPVLADTKYVWIVENSNGDSGAARVMEYASTANFSIAYCGVYCDPHKSGCSYVCTTRWIDASHTVYPVLD